MHKIAHPISQCTGGVLPGQPKLSLVIFLFNNINYKFFLKIFCYNFSKSNIWVVILVALMIFLFEIHRHNRGAMGRNIRAWPT